MVALFGGADVVTSGFSAGEPYPPRLHVKPPSNKLSMLYHHTKVRIPEKLNKEELEKLTKVAAIIEYIGNRQPKAKLYDWIYSDKLKLEEPYTPGLEKETFERVRRIIQHRKNLRQEMSFMMRKP
ncbi:hypothetical protein QPM05_12955 [Caldibacillus thermoamylovorans]|nr:hypothetical protein [Caldibacillus thermoamylovorans]